MGQIRRISVAVVVSCALAATIAATRRGEATFAIDHPAEPPSTTRVEAVGPLPARVAPEPEAIEPESVTSDPTDAAVTSSPAPTAAPITPPTGPTPTTRGSVPPSPAASPPPPTTGPIADTKSAVGSAPRRPGRAETRLLELIDGERADAGCASLVVDDALSLAAKTHSFDMARKSYFSITAPDGRGPAERARDAGYSGDTAENIAKDAVNPKQVLASWLREPSAKSNILSCTNTTVGIGVARSQPGVAYWTADFGTE